MLRLGGGDGVGGVLLAGPDSELLVLGVDEHLHIRRVVQLGGGLDVQLQHLAGDGGNGSGTGLDEVNDSKIAENSPLLRQMKVKWRKEVSRESQMRVISKSNGAIFHQKGICFWLTGPAWRLEVVRSREEMRREAYGFLPDG